MPYETEEVKGKGTCVRKKEGRKEMGCTKGPVEDYLAALHAADKKTKKENKTMKISKAELMEIIKEEIMGAMSEEQAVEEVAEEQPLEEMDVASMLSPENIEALRIAYEALQKLVTNGVIPMAALGAGAGALYNKVAGPQVPPEDMGDK